MILAANTILTVSGRAGGRTALRKSSRVVPLASPRCVGLMSSPRACLLTDSAYSTILLTWLLVCTSKAI